MIPPDPALIPPDCALPGSRLDFTEAALIPPGSRLDFIEASSKSNNFEMRSRAHPGLIPPDPALIPPRSRRYLWLGPRPRHMFLLPVCFLILADPA